MTVKYKIYIITMCSIYKIPVIHLTSSRKQEFHACAIRFFKIVDCVFLIFFKFEGPSLLVLGSPIKYRSFLVLLRVVRAVAGAPRPAYILADQLTLFKLWGQIMPTKLLDTCPS